jgi:hypothetical protein
MVKFSKFDLWEGYYNLGVEEESQKILAFVTTEGLFAPCVMPFGPSNCPTAMQRFMNHVFAPLYNRYGPCFKNYMDDCIIMTREGEDDLHREITIEFFKTLRENNLFLKPQKCAFEQSELNFLSLHVTPTGITIAPDKIAAIKDWPWNIQNVKELCQVLGVLGYQ